MIYDRGPVAIYTRVGPPVRNRLQLHSQHYYAELAVYHRRFWESVQAGDRIDRLLQIPFGDDIAAEMYAVPEDGHVYRIAQAQPGEDDHGKVATEHVYEREAPAGITRYIAWHRYNLTPIHGDDMHVLDLDRVQLDVYWQREPDTLLGDLTAVLNYWHIPYNVEDITWEDERQLHRAIIQLTVV